MNSSKTLTRFAFICAVYLSSFFNVGMGDESAESDATAEYYAQYYQDYYNNLADKNVAERDAGYHEPEHVVSHEYHEYSEPSYGYSEHHDSMIHYLEEMLGPEPALPLALINLVGLVAVGLHNIFQQIQIENLISRVNSLEDDQSSMCTSVKALGAVSGTSTNDATLWTQVTNIATPTCS